MMKRYSCCILTGLLLISPVVYAQNTDSDEATIYVKTDTDLALALPTGADVVIKKEVFADWVSSDPRVSSTANNYYLMQENGEKMLIVTKDIGPGLKVVKFLKKNDQNKTWFESDDWGSPEAKYEFQRKFKSYDDYGKD